MSSRGAVLSVIGSRNCFLKLPASWTSSSERGRMHIFRLDTVPEGGMLYTTWQGDVSSSTGVQSGKSEVVEISGMYATKHGFSHGAEVLLTRVEEIPVCKRLFVEPVSVDDWEILELHAEYLEQHLLDQVRVAWTGQVMPLWVNNKICIFVRVGSVEPAVDCCLLEQLTELHIAPKDRRTPASSKSKPEKLKSKTPTARDQMKVAPARKPMPTTNGGRPQRSPGYVGSQITSVQNGSVDSNTGDANHEDVFHRLVRYFHGVLFGVQTDNVNIAGHQNVPVEDDYSYKTEILRCCRKPKVSFRIQPCVITPHRPNGGLHVDSSVDIPPVEIANQPTCVYINHCQFRQTLQNLGLNNVDLNKQRTFLATITASKTPVEREEAVTKKMLNKNPLGTNRSSSDTQNPTDNGLLPDNSDTEVQPVVRVILLDRDNAYSLHGPSGAEVAQVRLRPDKGPLPGHVVVSDLLRRQLGLPVTGRLCLEALTDDDGTTHVTGITLHPLFSVPASFTKEMMIMAFKAWIREITCLHCPLVVSNGTLVKFFLKTDLYGEFLLTLEYTKPSSPTPRRSIYCLLQGAVCEDLCINVATRMTAANKPISIHLPCWNLSEIDPKLPSPAIQQLGGVQELFNDLWSHLRVSLAVCPLDIHLMDACRGQRSGAMLLSGPKGSGKSTLARAICRSLAELPPLAHVSVVDCKPLRGKRVDAIQKTLNKVFTEAVWRQPAIILLDDLDHIAAAPSGPEQEMSGEAVYFARVAEVLKDLCEHEVGENSAVVVMVTCRSQGALYSTLTSSRGHHFCQKMLHIHPPDKEQRRSMLEALLSFKCGIKEDCVKRLDLERVSSQTEGHVVRDLEQIVDRALHARRTRKSQGTGDKDLQDMDFQTALEGFTPMGLRHVMLHDNGHVTWNDVGGLHDVRRSLIETLQWPSKYPQLFANCPLRLRAGLLLYGAPGTGKTLLAAAVAKECELNFISIKGPELLSKYIGASEQAVRDTFERAQSAKPCILFFDEFDSLAPRRGHDNTGVTDRVVNQLLTQLDGVEGLEGVYVLAATSRPDLIDPALLRPGRLDKALHCTLPTEAERTEILEALSKQMSFAPDVNLRALASRCVHFTGADLKALLYNAQLSAINETTDLWASSLCKPKKSEKPMVSKDTSSGSNLQRNASFDFLVPENGAKRRRNNSSLSEGSSGSGSDLSAGQSASWEVVTELADKQQVPAAISKGHPLVQNGSHGLADDPTVVEKVEKTETQSADLAPQLVAYMPRLEDGVTSVSPQLEEQLVSQYFGNVKTTDTKAKTQNKGLISQISQRHLLEALQMMQPSVSESERRKFARIYDNFIASKGGGFGGSIAEAGQRATLA